ncbi:MAG TPA: MBL fold metallo-hydrolase [Methylomirabilota bacterium]|jgi:7,8-dihydropterin-6-yl-methyl-4-(beta-D-ribofuranosyl)aminobenzene 5'-phosphate synthase
MPPTPTVVLDELRVLVIVDNETDTLSSVDEGLPQVSELAHLEGRIPTSLVHEGHPGKVIIDRQCWAGHGFSALVTGRRGDEEHTVLFDAGPYPDLWTANAARLGIDLASVEAVFLSHWHFDHSGALPAAVTAVADARRRAGRTQPLIADLHPDRPDQRGVLLPTGTIRLLVPEPTFEALEAAGARVARHAEPHTLGEGFFFASGAIERVTAYERGLEGHLSFRGGQGQADPLILDERFLAVHVRGRGVSVLSACSHAGMVNACLGARDAFGGASLDMVLGGFHLSGRAMERRIEATVGDLDQRVRPRVVAPGHCTGWRAKAVLARTFAPRRYAPSVVGAMYVLKAE